MGQDATYTRHQFGLTAAASQVYGWPPIEIIPVTRFDDRPIIMGDGRKLYVPAKRTKALLKRRAKAKAARKAAKRGGGA